MNKSIPEITYIVSCYDRPSMLPVCLYSLKGQTHKKFEVIVTDNAIDQKIAAEHKRIVSQVNRKDGRFRYLHTNAKDCYWSAEIGVKRTTGTWLCFPCDDVYYVPQFGQKMLAAAALNGWDFITMGKVLLGPDACGFHEYYQWDLGRPLFPTGKSEFLIKREIFKGWPGKSPESVSVNCDRVLGQRIMLSNPRIPWGIVNECLAVHN